MKTFDPSYILCFLIAWMITNGWAYLLLGIGILFRWKIFTTIASAYLAFLWLPCTPEKILTAAIGIKLHKCLFTKEKGEK